MDFFDSEVSMTILNQSEEDERTGKKEHVVFLVSQRPLKSKKNPQPEKTSTDEEIVRDKEVRVKG